MTERDKTPSRSWRLAGGIAGAFLAAVGVMAAGIFSSAVDARPSAPAGITGLRDVLHVPPLFLAAGASVRLTYDVVCQADEVGTPCPIRGALFVRGDGERQFRSTPLEVQTESVLTGILDRPVTAGAAFQYYAVIEDGLGDVLTVPAGGASAPQRAWVLDKAIRVDLGAHVFGRMRSPDGTVVRASWGRGYGEVGLTAGRDQVRMGPSAFDVGPDGGIVVLDQLNDRLALYPKLGRSPRYLPISFAGAEGDLAVTSDGSIHVLDQGAEPVVRSYTSAGAAIASIVVEDHGPDMLRAGPNGPLLHGYPGDLWFPLQEGGAPLGVSERAARARAGLEIGDRSELVVSGDLHGATFALVRGDRVLRAWRVASETNLGEIQLAKRFGDGLVVVLRRWTESRAEFVALVLSAAGLERSFSIDTGEWAESAPLSRFRLDGRTLYQLRSAPSGVEVVSFDLGGVR